MFTDPSVPAAILAIYDSVAEPGAWDRLLGELEGHGVPRHLFDGDELPEDGCFEELALDESVRRLLGVLLPHMRRAWSLRREFVVRQRTMNTFCDALGPADFGLLVVDSELTVLWASPGVEALSGRYGVHFRDAGLEAPDGRVQKELTAALAAVLDESLQEALVRVPAPSCEGFPFLEIRVSPSLPPEVQLPPGFPERKGVTLLFSEVGALVDEAFIRRLQEVHSLTPAEARIASLAFEGRSPKEIAARVGSSYQTTRTHLRSIRAKTKTTSHTQLVALLHRGVAPLASVEQE